MSSRYDSPHRTSNPAPNPVEALQTKIGKLSKPGVRECNWSEKDLQELDQLIGAAYLHSHKRRAPCAGKEMRWLDANYPKLRLVSRIKRMIESVPSRPVTVIAEELRKISPEYDFVLIHFAKRPALVQRHKELLEKNSRYKELVLLSRALGEPKNNISLVRVADFPNVLQELSGSLSKKVSWGLEELKSERLKRQINQVLFLDLQREELFWRQAYWEPAGHLVSLIYKMRDDELMGLCRHLGPVFPMSGAEYLDRRKRDQTKERVRKHRSKTSQGTASQAP